MAAALHFVLVLFYLSAIQGQICPQPDFLPSVPDSASSKQCVFSHHCSKAKCIVTQGAHKLTVILKLNWCQEPVTATVKLQQPESKFNWSGTLQDGEKTKLAVTPSMFSGGLPVSDSSLFVLVGLKKMEGNLLNYTVAMVGNITAYDVVNPVNVVLLRGQTPVRSGKCGTIQGSDSSEKHSAEDHDGHPDEKPHNEDHEWHPDGKPHNEDHDGHPDEKPHSEDHEWHPDEKRHDQGTCSPARFSGGTVCPVTNHCSKITCTSPGNSDGGRMVLTVQINGCSGPLTATVTMESSLTNTSEKWSHTFANGDKAKPPMLSGGGVEVHYEFKVELEKTIDNIKFQLTMSMEGKEESSEFASLDILTAKLALPNCGMIQGSNSSEKHSDEDHDRHPDEKPHSEDHEWHPNEKRHDQGTCSPARFRDGTVCPVTNHCSKITCTLPDSVGGRMMLTVQINGCSGPLTATVTMGSSLTNTSEKWSHTFANGDKAKPPMLSGDGVEEHYEFKVELEKTIDNIKFQLTMSIEGKEESSEFASLDILTAKLALPNCGGSQKWFSKQPTSVQVLVIFLPVLVLVLVGLGVAFYCYRNSGRGGRFPVHLTAGGSKVAMQRLTNEV